jgi:hypothetical protein
VNNELNAVLLKVMDSISLKHAYFNGVYNESSVFVLLVLEGVLIWSLPVRFKGAACISNISVVSGFQLLLFRQSGMSFDSRNTLVSLNYVSSAQRIIVYFKLTKTHNKKMF